MARQPWSAAYLQERNLVINHWPSKHRGFGIGPTTLSCKKNQVRETATKEPHTTAVHIGLQRKSMSASGESRKEATGSSEVLSAKAKT